MQDDWIKCFTWQRNSTYSSRNKTTSALCTYRFFHLHAEQDRELHLQQESSLDSHWESALCLAFLGAANFSPSCFDDNHRLAVQPLSPRYNNLLDKTLLTTAPAKNLIASNDASETKVLPNEFFLNCGFIFPSSLISQGHRNADPTPPWEVTNTLTAVFEGWISSWSRAAIKLSQLVPDLFFLDDY